MDHQTACPRQTLSGIARLRKGATKQSGRSSRNRLFGHRIVDIEFDRHLMARRRQLDVQPLSQAVETMGQEQNAHED